MEKCKDGKVAANHAIPISSVGIFYLQQVITALHSLQS
jgi:hypothetical protein